MPAANNAALAKLWKEKPAQAVKVVIDAIIQSRGNLKKASRLLYIDERTLYRYAKRNTSIAEVIERTRGEEVIGVRQADRLVAGWLARHAGYVARDILVDRARSGEWRKPPTALVDILEDG